MKKITYNIFTVIFIAILFTQCNTPKHTMSVAQIPPVAPKPTIKVADSTQYIIVPTKPQPILLTDPKDNFEQSYQVLKAMLQDTQTADFERAVFLSENPYHNSKYTYEQFQQIVDAQLTIIEKLIAVSDKSDTMNFDAYVGANGKFKMADMRFLPKEKKVLYQKALTNWAIFSYLTDTLTIQIKDSNNLFTFYHPPFTYVSNDPFGKKDWSNTQVISLLFSEQQKGNCFSLTALFKILANRLGSDARICTAPQHSYIQHKDNKGDYYNIELATAGFPRDGTIQTLTHTTSTAIKSGIALRDYTEKESIGLCLVNLAKSYEHYYETKDDDFLLKCAEVVLQTDSFNLSALLLKQQVLDERVTKYALSNAINSISKLQQDKNIQQTVTDLQIHLQLLYRLGYRQMPIDMQQIIMSGIYPENGFEDKNASPFTTIKPKDIESITYQSLSGGLFQEVYDTKPTELYGHFVFDTKTKQLKAIDTKAQDNFLIDPVAFAYDFGARMYDARVGRFLSTDPLMHKYPYASPYSGMANNPIIFIDNDGNEPTLFFWLYIKFMMWKENLKAGFGKVVKASDVDNNTNNQIHGSSHPIAIHMQKSANTVNVVEGMTTIMKPATMPMKIVSQLAFENAVVFFTGRDMNNASVSNLGRGLAGVFFFLDIASGSTSKVVNEAVEKTLNEVIERIGLKNTDELADVFTNIEKAAGTKDAIAGIKGSAVSGKKHSGGLFDADSDLDFFVVSDDLYNQAVKNGAKVSKNTNGIHYTETKAFPELIKMQENISEKFGRDATIRIYSIESYNKIIKSNKESNIISKKL